MNLFDRIAKHPKKLTHNETVLVDFIVSCYPQGMLGSATDIADRVGVSASTVVRLFAKLGYESFGHLQREIRAEVSSKLASPSQRAHLAIQEESAPSTVLDRVFTFDKDNLNATREANSAEDFQRFVDTIIRSDGGRIHLLGSKNSYPVAHYLHTHLNMCMPGVNLLGTGGGLLADELLWVDPRDTLIVVSIRRYSRQVTQAARHFRQIGASVISITDSPLAPIAGLSDHRLLIQTASASPFDSYTAAFTLCNAVVAAVALHRKKEIEALLEQGEKLWDHFDVFLGMREV